jgi:hypothetical protein
LTQCVNFKKLLASSLSGTNALDFIQGPKLSIEIS